MKKVDALESYNNVYSKKRNEQATALSGEHKKIGLASSGAKYLGDIGKAYSAMWSSVNFNPTSVGRRTTTTPGELVQALKTNITSLNECMPHGERGGRISTTIVGSSWKSRLAQILAIAEVKCTGNVN